MTRHTGKLMQVNVHIDDDCPCKKGGAFVCVRFKNIHTGYIYVHIHYVHIHYVHIHYVHIHYVHIHYVHIHIFFKYCMYTQILGVDDFLC